MARRSGSDLGCSPTSTERVLLPTLDDPTVAERAVVVQLLGRAHAAPPAELYAAIRDGATPTDIDRAVLSLTEAGVIHQDAHGSLHTTTALQRLDALGLICV
jgi:hypothetical protein